MKRNQDLGFETGVLCTWVIEGEAFGPWNGVMMIV